MRWDSSSMDPSLCFFTFTIQLNERPLVGIKRRHTHFVGELVLSRLKSIMSTGYECQRYFVELRRVFIFLKM